MSKKTATAIIAIVILILIGVFVWFFFSGSNEGGEGDNISPTTPIFPGGGSGSLPDTSGNNSSDNSFGIQERILNRISDTPVSGSSIFENKEGDVLVRYVDRGKGNIFETPLKTLEKRRISSKTIPQVYEALWNNTGSEVLLRYLDDTDSIITYHAEIIEDADEESSLIGTFLSPSIRDVSVSPDGSSIFYISPNANGSSGIRSSFSGGGRSQLWSSPLKEWLVEWSSTNAISLVPKPGYGAPGSLTLLNPTTGGSESILNSLSGFTALANIDRTRVLYSTGENNKLSTFLYNVSTKKNIPFYYTTLPEKCIWSRLEKNTIFCAIPSYIPNGEYPDVWYQGITLFSDDIWRLNTEDYTSTHIVNLRKESGEDIDATELHLSPNEDYLVFTNKVDLSLWSLKVAE